MPRKKAAAIKEQSIPLGVIIGMFSGSFFVLLFICILSYMIDHEMMNFVTSKTWIAATLFLSSAGGSFIGYTFAKQNRLLVCLLISIMLFLFLLGISALFYSGKFQSIALHFFMVMLGGIFAAFSGLLRKTKKTYHYKK